MNTIEAKLEAAKDLRNMAEQETKWTIRELLVQTAERLEREARIRQLLGG